jgi:hypothetical protein
MTSQTTDDVCHNSSGEFCSAAARCRTSISVEKDFGTWQADGNRLVNVRVGGVFVRW